ncbi:MAG TPA: hypothetical protein VE778_05690 [Candidatus Bathyarchaeia archaeon]|jgi:hypothetical protein|nr:hypothetical protein [Candidatus Bathyarchaeia archaeon]
MNRVYEIFEVPPNGSPQKVTVVPGLEFAKVTLQALAKRTQNECFAADAKTRQLVMQLNVPPAKLRRIFQITYDEELGTRRAELLRSRGYGVISVIGNEAAKTLLSSIQPYDLFIVGHAAPQETRREMVDWLNVQYPRVKVLALNPSFDQVPAADYNAPYHGSDTWLPIVSTICERRSTPRA